jgi:hypothetical protein
VEISLAQRRASVFAGRYRVPLPVPLTVEAPVVTDLTPSMLKRALCDLSLVDGWYGG